MCRWDLPVYCSSWYHYFFPQFEWWFREWTFQRKIRFNPDPSKQAQEVIFTQKFQRLNYPLLIFNDSFFSIWVFFHKHLQSTEQQAKMGSYLLNSFLPFPSASQNLNISQAITAENLPLHIGCSQTRTKNFWFPSTKC